MSGHGNVPSDAHEQNGFAVRAPISINADVIAPTVEAVDVAGEGCCVKWRDSGALGVLPNADFAAPLGLGGAGELEFINACELERVAALDAFRKTRLVRAAARARLVPSTLFAPSVVRVGRGDLGRGSTGRRRGEARDAPVPGTILGGNPLHMVRRDLSEIGVGDLIGKDDEPWSCLRWQWGAAHTAFRVWFRITVSRTKPPLSELTLIVPPRASIIDVLLPAWARWLGRLRGRLGDAASRILLDN